MKERRLEHLVGVLQKFIKSENEQSLFDSFVALAKPLVADWASASSLSLENWPEAEWLLDRLYLNPPCSVTDHRWQVKELLALQTALRADGKKLQVANFKKKSSLKNAKLWVLSGDYDRHFSSLFKYDATESNELFSLCYLAMLNEIDFAIRATSVIGCQECGLLMIKQGKRVFCSEDCRTKHNNQKRDPSKHNEREKQNRKQRIINKNAKERVRRKTHQ